MAAYEEYLPAEWRDAYDEWRGGYTNPYRDLQDDGRTRNWDNERRVSEQYADGVVAEITFPNTVPPFYPTGALLARSPKNSEEFARRKAGLQCHNRWLSDWCSEYPDQRRGLPQIFLEDLDDAIKTLTWAANEGFKSFLMPHVAPDVDLPGLWSPEWDRLWAAVQDLDLVVTQHGGNGTPDYGKDPASGVIFLCACQWSHLEQLIVSDWFGRQGNLERVSWPRGGRTSDSHTSGSSMNRKFRSRTNAWWNSHSIDLSRTRGSSSDRISPRSSDFTGLHGKCQLVIITTTCGCGRRRRR